MNVKEKPIIAVSIPHGVVIYDRIRANIERRAIERGDVLLMYTRDAGVLLAELDQRPCKGAIVGPLPAGLNIGSLTKPAVAITRGPGDLAPVPRITSDNSAIGRLAARHLHAAGARYLLGIDWIRRPFAEERLAAFKEEAERSGIPCRIRWIRVPSHREPIHFVNAWENRLGKKLCTVLSKLPERSGIFATTDDRAIALWRAARLCGRRIPQDLLLIGVDDLESAGLLPLQGLTSIALDCSTIGRRCLDRVMDAINGGSWRVEDELIPPLGVIARQSTHAFPMEDPILEKALQRIRERAHLEDTAETLADAVGVSRVTLWRKFESMLGRTPAEALREARMEHARRLLRETRLTVREVAVRCGFTHASAFARFFRHIEGLSPQQWRRYRA